MKKSFLNLLLIVIILLTLSSCMSVKSMKFWDKTPRAKWEDNENFLISVDIDTVKTKAMMEAKKKLYSKYLEYNNITNMYVDSLTTKYFSKRKSELNAQEKSLLKYFEVNKQKNIKNKIFTYENEIRVVLGMKKNKDFTDIYRKFFSEKLKSNALLTKKIKDAKKKDNFREILNLYNKKLTQLEELDFINRNSNFYPENIFESVDKTRNEIEFFLRKTKFYPKVKSYTFIEGKISKKIKLSLRYSDAGVESVNMADVNLSLETSSDSVKLASPNRVFNTDSNGNFNFIIQKVLGDKLQSIKVCLQIKNVNKQIKQFLPIASIKLIPENSSMSNMIKIPSGYVTLGGNSQQIDEKEEVRVWVNSFYIDPHEVTNAEYEEFLKETGHSKPKYWNIKQISQSNKPVVGISWKDAKAYADWAGKRLPTEAEWQLAAEGSGDRKYPWGNEFEANYSVNSYNSTTTSKVGSIPIGRSQYGIYDLAGNVWEFCSDWYNKKSFNNVVDGNYIPPSSGSKKVIKGGGWKSKEKELRCSNRMGVMINTKSDDIGFRLVKNIK